jgi:hypothetical protein
MVPRVGGVAGGKSAATVPTRLDGLRFWPAGSGLERERGQRDVAAMLHIPEAPEARPPQELVWGWRVTSILDWRSAEDRIRDGRGLAGLH